MNCHMHPKYPADDCIGCDLDLADSQIEDQQALINKLRAALQEIFAMRGEDELIAKIASPLIDETRGI